MNKREVSELFGVMLLGWPNAEMFKGGIAKLGPTIELWSACVADVDYWTGRQAVLLLCKECKFPPTIAEFRSMALLVNKRISARFDTAINDVKARARFGKTPSEIYSGMCPDDPMRIAIDRIGGPEKMLSRDGKMWMINDLRSAFTDVMRRTPAALDGVRQSVKLPSAGK